MRASFCSVQPDRPAARRGGWMLVLLWGGALAAGMLLTGPVGQWVTVAPAALGRWLRALSLSGGAGNAAAWAVTAVICALPLLGLLLRGRCRADGLLPLTGVVLLVWLFYLVNPSLLGTALPMAEGWGLAGFAAAGSLMVTWAVLRLLKRLDGSCGLMAQVLYVGAAAYVLLLGLGTGQQAAEEAAAVAAANTGSAAALTVAAIRILAVWKSVPLLLTAALVLWGGDLLRALEDAPFAGETVALADRIAGRCDGVIYAALFVTVSCNLVQMALFSRLVSVDVTVYFPVMTVVLAAVLRTLCRYFRRAKAISDDNDTII